MRRSVVPFLGLVASVAIVSGCGAARDPLPFALWCSGGGLARATATLSRQSVPTASRRVCFATMPQGWTAASLRIGDDGTQVVLDHDRLGDGAFRLRLTRSCVVDGATLVGRDRGVVTFRDVSPRLVRRFDRFPGGCVVSEIVVSGAGGSAVTGIEAAVRLPRVRPDEAG
jgi:hypothetical protein